MFGELVELMDMRINYNIREMIVCYFGYIGATGEDVRFEAKNACKFNSTNHCFLNAGEN